MSYFDDERQQVNDYTVPALVVAAVVQIILVSITGSAQVIAIPVALVPFDLAAGGFEIAYIINQIWRRITSPFT